MDAECAPDGASEKAQNQEHLSAHADLLNNYQTTIKKKVEDKICIH